MPLQITTMTFGDVISFICRLVGFPISADPAGSTDPKHLQMQAAITDALAELLTLNEWQDLTKRGSISVVADGAGQQEKAFDLPDDFYRFIDQTQWDSASLLPAGGPVPPQGWMWAIIQSVVPAMQLFWQLRQDQLWIMSPPFPTPVNYEFFYISNAQIIDQDDPTLYKNVPTKNGDKFVLDSYMVALLARKKWLEWNGFNSDAANRDYNMVFNSRAGNDKGAPILNLARRPQLPLITPCGNVPLTGYGS